MAVKFQRYLYMYLYVRPVNIFPNFGHCYSPSYVLTEEQPFEMVFFCLNQHELNVLHVDCLYYNEPLTHWGRDQIDAISQTFSNAFSRMKINEFRLGFHWSFVPKVRINNIPALVQIMAWRRPGDKSLSEPMMVSLLMHICVTRPQWVNWKFQWYQSFFYE